ncbi:murein biosynthesis integral membrane protein MurJ [Quadrisphaera sp. DSM 44207]|uniref:murein biosynthesis integral membrane protein MurJ n=1 Tax=Quadrisphaera sp. DSM 44207 TaxID=1881057 RepID=UPI00087E6434|nr:murein biosynthesis integral membrane protein MurJ [Quadrisphaera sp. DSM 44207]SDQ23456.1 putative peptidoglycan lipid II flippase [Quadrisphaera sp. DSM 44207]
MADESPAAGVGRSPEASALSDAPPGQPVLSPQAPPAAAQAQPTLARSSTVMAAGTAVSRLLGFLRAFVLVVAIGSTLPAADAFATANTVPNNLYLLIAGGVLNAVLVPQVVRAARRPDGGEDYVNRLVTAAVVFFAVVTVLLVAAAPLVVSLFAAEFDGPLRALTVAFALWCLPQVFFYALYTLLGQLLNARGSFGPYMWAPVVNNVVALVGLGAFIAVFGTADPADPAAASVDWSPGRVALLAGTATLGVAVQALVLLVPLRRAGVRLRPRWGLRGTGLRSAGRTAGWTFAAVVVGQVGFLAVSNTAAAARDGAETAADGLATAGLTAWGLAYLVFMLPHSLVAVSVVTALFTRMSRSAAAEDAAAVREDVSSGMRTIGIASVLATVGLLVLAVPIGVVISNGALVPGRAVGRVVFAMAFGLAAFSASYLVQRAFYAFEDARTPFLVQCLVVATWTAGALVAAAVLPDEDKVVGVAAAMALGQVLGLVLGVALLRRRLGGLDGYRVVRTHVRLLLAGLVAGACGAAVAQGTSGLLDDGLLGALAVVAAAGAVVVGVYAAGLWLLHVEEVRPLVRRLTRRG